MKKAILLSAVAFLGTSAFANSTLEAKVAQMMEKMEQQQAKIEALTSELSELKGAQAGEKEFASLKKKVAKVEKKQKRQAKVLSEVKAHDAYDNIKFSANFRNTFEKLDYKNNDTGTTYSNDSLLTSRLFLDMSAAPADGLIFKGKLAIYSLWGAHLYHDYDSAMKSWAGSSKASDTVMRIKEGYFVYSNEMGEQPYSLSVGRRPSSNGFLANYRENQDNPASPLAHITNMEVDAAMLKLDWGRFVDGAYSKFVYGRAHTGEIEGVYGNATNRMPFADKDNYLEDENVDFFVLVGDAYNNGQYELMYQWAHIFNTKGKALNEFYPEGHASAGKPVVKAASGVADLYALSLKTDGVGDEINDFLDNTTLFASVAYTNYDAKEGHSLLGSTDAGSKSGHSFWLGAVFPDMLTEGGKLGLEYNKGSQYWTPMTWAEDTAIGSKIAVRGSAYEAYWNFDLFGVKYLPSQLRYTYVQHDYTPNINCAGWVTPLEADITSQNLRFALSYQY